MMRRFSSSLLVSFLLINFGVVFGQQYNPTLASDDDYDDSVDPSDNQSTQNINILLQQQQQQQQQQQPESDDDSGTDGVAEDGYVAQPIVLNNDYYGTGVNYWPGYGGGYYGGYGGYGYGYGGYGGYGGRGGYRRGGHYYRGHGRGGYPRRAWNGARNAVRRTGGGQFYFKTKFFLEKNWNKNYMSLAKSSYYCLNYKYQVRTIFWHNRWSGAVPHVSNRMKRSNLQKRDKKYSVLECAGCGGKEFLYVVAKLQASLKNLEKSLCPTVL